MYKIGIVLLLFFLTLGTISFSWAQDKSLPYYQAGNSFYSQKNYAQAIRYYQAATQMNPQLWQAYQGMGNCYYAQGDKATALTNYQKALSLNPGNTQLAGFVQSLQAQAAPPAASTSVAENTSPVSSQTQSTPVRGAVGNAHPFEVDLLGGGDLILSASNPFPTTVSGTTVPTLAGGYGAGFGGGAGAYYSINPHFAVGANAAFYTYGANYNYNSSGMTFGYSYNAAATETVTQSNVEILGGVKYRFDGKDLQPYILGGVGFALVSVSGAATVNATVTGYGSFTDVVNLAPTSSFNPMVQFGGGVAFPVGDNMNFFAEGKLGVVFMGSSNQSVSTNGTSSPYTSPSSTLLELPVNVGINFNL